MSKRATVRTGSIVVVALAVLVGVSLIAAPALAQEMTDDEIATEGGTMGDGNGSDGSTTTVDRTGEDAMAGNETMTGEGTMENEETVDDGTTTDAASTHDGEADETASDGQPGFGLAIALVAVLAAVGAAIARRVE